MKLTRRALLTLIAAFGVVSVVLLFRRSDLRQSIRRFFAFEEDADQRIQQELQSMRIHHPTWFAASLTFFTLADRNAHWLVPTGIQHRIVNFWAWRLLSIPGRSVSWPYVDYPTVDETYICNGLIRPQA